MTSAELKYLISIDELYEGDGEKGIKLVSIASKMNVTKVSVFRAIERLEKGGYIRRNDKNKVMITEYGYDQLSEYRMMIDWLGSHLAKHCGVPTDIAFQDAIGATCAMNDKSRHGLAEFIKSGKADGRKEEQ